MAPTRRSAAAAGAIATLGCLGLLVACATGRGPGPRPPDAVPAAVHDEVRALVSAPPPHWPERAESVLDRGPVAAPALAAAIRSDRGAPGEMCAIGVLGGLGNTEAALPLLMDLLTEDGEAGTEAALALGRLGADQARPALSRALEDATLSPANRTAAAAALCQLGEPNPAADFLAAILVAGTPYGVDSSRRFGLPRKGRWALERTLAITAIRRTFGQDFGLDPDASWPQLADGRTAFLAHVRNTMR